LKFGKDISISKAQESPLAQLLFYTRLM